MKYAVILLSALIGFAYGRLLGAAICIYLSIKAYNYFTFKSKFYDRTPREGPNDAYSILGVKRTDSIEEIKRAYHNLAKSYHPDIMKARGASEKEIKKASEKMAKINEAWHIISDKHKYEND